MNFYYFLALLTLLNVIVFAVFGIDKYLARKRYRRISEKTLLRLAVFGGSIGAIAGQKIFRHKTQKLKGVLQGILLVHAVLVCLSVWAGLGADL